MVEKLATGDGREQYAQRKRLRPMAGKPPDSGDSACGTRREGIGVSGAEHQAPASGSARTPARQWAGITGHPVGLPGPSRMPCAPLRTAVSRRSCPSPSGSSIRSCVLNYLSTAQTPDSRHMRREGFFGCAFGEVLERGMSARGLV